MNSESAFVEVRVAMVSTARGLYSVCVEKYEYIDYENEWNEKINFFFIKKNAVPVVLALNYLHDIRTLQNQKAKNSKIERCKQRFR